MKTKQTKIKTSSVGKLTTEEQLEMINKGIDAECNRDYENALKHYEEAALSKNPYAMWRYGLCKISNSTPCFQFDILDGINYVKEAAKRGIADAYSDLYLLYSTGKVVDKDNKKASFYYKKAYEGHSLELLLINIYEYLTDDHDGEPDYDNVKIWLVEYLMNPASGHFEYSEFYKLIKEMYKDKLNFQAIENKVSEIILNI